LSTRLFYALAAIAVVFTVAGVLVFQSRRSSSSDSAFGGKDDPVLDAKVRRLQFYDWETNVIGPDGRPAPRDAKVTGGPNAGRSGALALYDAVLLAARRPARVEADTGRPGSVFFAVDSARKRVLGSAAATRAAAAAAAPSGARIYEVRPDTAIVGAEGSADRAYVLKDDVAISGTEIRHPRQGIDQISRRRVTLFDFSDTGLRLFRNLTKAIAQRGSQLALDAGATNPTAFNQHFAVVYQAQLVTVPFVDFRQNPDGIDARAGTQLAEQLP
jgi:SecD/SecF fusion protein